MMATAVEIIDGAAPCATWLIENVQHHTSGPLEALAALEVAKRTVLVLASELPGFKEQWDRLQREFDDISFSVQKLGKAGDA